MPHTIRLRHPWQCQPCDGGSRWLRRFNWPADLTAGETALLVIQDLPATAQVELNDQPIADNSAGRFDITAKLARSNQLAIKIAAVEPTDQTECPYPVSLQIVEH